MTQSLYPDPDHPRVEYDWEANRGYVIYTAGFFGGVPLGCLALMVYNLILMFGLDVPIQNAQKNFMDWFTTPTVKEAIEVSEEAGGGGSENYEYY